MLSKTSNAITKHYKIISLPKPPFDLRFVILIKITVGSGALNFNLRTKTYYQKLKNHPDKHFVVTSYLVILLVNIYLFRVSVGLNVLLNPFLKS